MPTTAEAGAFWLAQRQDQLAWLELYRLSHERSDRALLSAAVKAIGPFTSVFEVGCHCGPVLKRLREDFGPFAYHGIDLSSAALDYGRFWADADGYGENTIWQVGSVTGPEMDLVADQSFDVVVSSSSLVYVSPQDLPSALRSMARIAKKAVIIQEPLAGDRHEPDYHQWSHDYLKAWATPGFNVSQTGIVTTAVRQ